MHLNEQLSVQRDESLWMFGISHGRDVVNVDKLERTYTGETLYSQSLSRCSQS